MLIGRGGEVLRRRRAANNDQLLIGVVNKATNIFVTLGTTCIDGPVRVLALGRNPAGHKQERQREQKLRDLGSHRELVILVNLFLDSKK